MIFAAKIVADGTADGGFHWVAVGNGTAGQTNVLDTSGAHGFGSCAESQDAEDACTLNAVAGRDAENPRVAAGTLRPGGPTVPWVVWQEELGEAASTPSSSRAWWAATISSSSTPASRCRTRRTTRRGPTSRSPATSRTSPGRRRYPGRRRPSSATSRVGAAAPVFELDTPTGIANSGLRRDVVDPLRAPISSGCTANPTNADGASCQGGALGTPFLLYTAGQTGAQKLFAQAFAPTDVSTLAATDISETDATLNGSANPGGAAVLTRFDFGATTAYGTSTADARLDVASVATAFDATLSGLTQDATVHFRAVAKTDFVTVEGPDQSFVVANTPPTVSIDDLPDEVRGKDLGSGRLLTVQLTVSEPATSRSTS